MKNLRTVLLAEDNPYDIELILDVLLNKKLANNVSVVSDGVEVLEYLRYEGKYKMRGKEDPAVILLDIKMPRLNGIEVLREIRNDSALQSIPVVMLTSSSEEPDLKLCYELGVNAYVVKPVDFKDFVNAVTEVGMFWALLNEVPKRELLSN